MDKKVRIQKERGREVPYSNYNTNHRSNSSTLLLPLSWKEMYLVRRMTSNVEDEDEEDEEPLNLSSIPLINRQQWIVHRFDPSVPRRWWWISAILSIFGTYRCHWNRTSRAEVKELFRGMAFPDARCYRLLLLPLYPYERRNLSKMATNPSAIRMVNKG